jgi:putative aldouronate transport system substrate-binding protein
MSHHPPVDLDRRRFLKCAGAGATLLAGAAPLVGGCGSGTPSTAGTTHESLRPTPTSGSSPAKTPTKLPTYVRYQGVTPDFPESPAGALAGYIRYPANPIAATTDVPGSGGAVTAFTDIFLPVPPGVGGNKFWQELNKKLGVDLKVNMVSDTDYANKSTTLLASGDLPDFMQIVTPPPQMAELLAAKFQDLTDFLSGDGAKDYPFLANLPTDSWRSTIYNGGIYGLPITRPIIGSAFFKRQDLIDARGLNGAPKNFQELLDLCRGLTDSKANRYASGDPVVSMLTFVREMLAIPNDWSEKDGQFTSVYETDTMRKALNSVRTMVQAGVFHPDSFSSSTVSRKTWFAGKITALNYDNYLDWLPYATDPSASGIQVGALVPPGFDGGPGTHRPGAPTFGIVALKKAAKPKIEELLRIANWLAVPYGTQEYLFRKFGIADVDYTLHNGNPQLTSRGTSETTLPLQYICDSPYVLGPGPEDIVKPWHDFQATMIPLVVKDPTVGLYSDTQSQLGPQLSTIITNAVTEFLRGRQSLSDWDAAVKKWLSQGGDKIRQEYEKSYQDSH